MQHLNAIQQFKITKNRNILQSLNEVFAEPISQEVVNFFGKLMFALESIYVEQTMNYYNKLNADDSKNKESLQDPPF